MHRVPSIPVPNALNRDNIYAIPKIPPRTSIAPTGIAGTWAAPPVTLLAAALVILATTPPELELEPDMEPELDIAPELDMELDMELDIDPEELDEPEELEPLLLPLLPLELPPVTEFKRELGAPVTEERIDPTLVMELRRPEEL